MTTQRTDLIDLLKGGLIVLVVVGHIADPHSFFRYANNIFHRPLLIGLSGYLFNDLKLRKLSCRQLFSKYESRVILPWTIAVPVYFLLVNRPTSFSTGLLSDFAQSFITPYYHLWFIPAYLSWIFVTWYLRKRGMGYQSILILSGFISVLFLTFLEYPGLYDVTRLTKISVGLLLHTFRPQFYVFFVLGLYFKHFALKGNKRIILTSVLVLYISICLLFDHPNRIVYILLYLAFNTLSLGLMVGILTIHSHKRVDLGLKWIGANSMGIYLWHVVPIFMCKTAFGFVYSPEYYLACTLVLSLFLTIMSQLTKNQSVNRLLFGVIHR